MSRRALLVRRTFAWGAGWVFAAALYLLLIDTTDLPELLVGAGVAALAATGLELAREQGVVGENFRWQWLRRAYRPLLTVPADVAVVSATALAQLFSPQRVRGQFRVVRFRCGEEERLESGRHSVAIGFGSLAPNTVIIGVDRDRELILAHQLRRRGGREAIDLMELG